MKSAKHLSGRIANGGEFGGQETANRVQFFFKEFDSAVGPEQSAVDVAGDKIANIALQTA